MPPGQWTVEPEVSLTLPGPDWQLAHPTVQIWLDMNGINKWPGDHQTCRLLGHRQLPGEPLALIPVTRPVILPLVEHLCLPVALLPGRGRLIRIAIQVAHQGVSRL